MTSREYPEYMMVVHACNPSIWEAEAGRLELETSLDYITRLCLKKKRTTMRYKRIIYHKLQSPI
jgi:hypothetical protein